MGQHRARDRLAAWVSDLCRPIPYDEHDFVSKVLELTELPQTYDMAKMDIATGGVKTHLESKGLSRLQQASELIFINDFRYASLGDHVQCFFR
jgi:hypothetical protein